MKHFSIVFVSIASLLLPDSISAKRQPDPLFPIWNNQKWVYINPTGEIVLRNSLASNSRFYEGMAHIRHDHKTGFMDNTGKTVIPPKYRWAEPFSEGLAMVIINKYFLWWYRGYRYTYIDKKGNEPLDLNYGSLKNFHEGLACVGKYTNNKGWQYGYINRKGKLIIPIRFSHCRDYSQGRAAVAIGKKWTFIDKQGIPITKATFDSAYSFSGGLALIQVSEKYGYLNRKGQIVIKPKYKRANSFSDGLAVVTANDSFGCINAKGKWIIKPTFRAIADFSEGLAWAIRDTKRQSTERGYINHSGRFVIHHPSPYGGKFQNGVAKIDYYGPKFYSKDCSLVINSTSYPVYINKKGEFIREPSRPCMTKKN